MNAQIKSQVKAHALKENPNECCGLISANLLGEIKVFECENKAVNKKNRFVIDPQKNIEAYNKFGDIVGFYHSHAGEFAREDNNKFSKEDLDIAYEACIPALLYVYPQDKWHYYRPDTYKPVKLLGRPFIWGIWDCYSLVKDYYKLERNIKLGDYFAPDNATVNSDFKYETFVNQENFIEVPLGEMRKDDVMIFKIKSKFWNHSAIYLGGNEFLHQPINKISSIGMLDDRYIKYIAKILRYND